MRDMMQHNAIPGKLIINVNYLFVISSDATNIKSIPVIITK